MKWNYQSEVLVLPGAVLSASANAVQLRVLLWLASDLSLGKKPRQLAKLADCTPAEAGSALDFWMAQGVLRTEEATEVAPVQAAKAVRAVREEPSATPTKKLLQRADELPNYTSSELAELLEKRAGVRAMVDEAQRILGKIFNPSEINVLVGMYDYMGLSEEGILLLLAHCKNIGKANLRAIEKYAYRLVDRDITTPAALEEEFRTVEALHSFEGQVRTLFGMKARALTGREDRMLRAWVSFGYDMEVVRRAYEMTVAATNEASLPYANAILERWHAEGLQTAADVDRAIAEQKAKKDGQQASLGNSFDTDDFFEAALKRSFSTSKKDT
ncbi:MAG: DnaD domain protein [Clostridia bacterium]|nr:DnaD domain protein [Clostridia bacterium]